MTQAVRQTVRKKVRKDGQQDRQGCPHRQGDEPPVPDREDHSDENLRLKVLEGRVLCSHRSVLIEFSGKRQGFRCKEVVI